MAPRKPGRRKPEPAAEAAPEPAVKHAEGGAPVYVEHADHLVVMEKLLAEVGALRAAIAAGFDKLTAALLDEAVTVAAEPVAVAHGIKVTPTGTLQADVPDAPPADPVTHDAPDASKKHLAPAKAKATLDEVREALNAYTRDHGLAEASKVVQGLGVKRLTELPPERYAEAVAAFQG